MSAFQCSDDHIRLLALALVFGVGDKAGRDAVGCALEAPEHHESMHRLLEARENVGRLYRANRDSLCARYGGDEGPERTPLLTLADIKRLRGHLSDPMLVIKQAQCFAYQACEVDSWEGSDLEIALLRLISNATYALPGNKDAPWGI